MDQTPNDAQVEPGAVAAVRPRTLRGILSSLFGIWLLLFIVCYAISFQSLTAAAITLLVLVFAISTFRLYSAKDLISKRFVKALDYFTILTFITGIVAISEIDTQSVRDRAERASARIAGLQVDAQKLLQPQLDARCQMGAGEVSLSELRRMLFNLSDAKDFFAKDRPRLALFCSLFANLSGKELGTIPLEQIRKSLGLGRTLLVVRLLPDFDQTRDAMAALSEYTFARSDIESSNPIGTYISKTIAFLLVSFAFAVRLTRTTLEVFEWHTG